MEMTSDIVDMWAGSEVSSNGNDFRHCGYVGRFRSIKEGELVQTLWVFWAD